MRIKKPKRILSKNPIGNLGRYAHASKMPTYAKLGVSTVKLSTKTKTKRMKTPKSKEIV